MKGATSIQERLWELRKDKGLNLEELSKLTGISKSALGSYEKECCATVFLRNTDKIFEKKSTILRSKS